jgi:hypothetical protein
VAAVLVIALLLLVAIAVVALRRTDRSVESFARAHDLQLTDAERPFLTFHLARMEVLRARGTWIGFAAAVLAGWAFGLSRAFVFVLALGGSLVGMGAAEAARYFRRPPDHIARTASLERRDRNRYLTPGTRRVERIVATLFALASIAALALPSHHSIWIRIAVIGGGLAVLAGGRLVHHRIAIRPAAPVELSDADAAVRSAAMDVVGAIVASLVLCTVIWLIALPARRTSLTVHAGSTVVARVRDVGQSGWSLGGTAESIVVMWKDPHDNSPQKLEVAWPPDPGPREPPPSAPVVQVTDPGGGPPRTTQLPMPSDARVYLPPLWAETQFSLAGQVGYLAALPLGGWAFVEWLQVSRLPFRRRRTKRGNRPPRVTTSAAPA